MDRLQRTDIRPGISSQPKFKSVEPNFFSCPRCGNLFIKQRAGDKKFSLVCCGQSLSELLPSETESFKAKHLPVITISGGFSANAATVKVGEKLHPTTQKHHIEWIYLHTFQGGQLKFLKAGEEPVVIFSLAGEDAYVYCDRPVCKVGVGHCMFNCKHGFTAYAFCKQHGLWKTQM